MTASVWMAFLHHLAAFALVAGIAVELALLRFPVDATRARRLLTVDAAVGISAGVVLVAGVLRVIYFEKGAAFYMGNGAFIAKMALFALIALGSLVPTLTFLSWRRAIRRGEAPPANEAAVRRLRSVVHAELAGIVLVLLAAAAMARGAWMLG